jgi:hypothetical protein
MIVTDWHEVMRQLWSALKSFLTFAQQQEHNLINERFKIPRLKPLLPKDKKPVAAAVKEKHPKAVPPALKVATPKPNQVAVKNNRKAERKVERKVEFEDDAVRVCISDLARHYKIKTTLSPCAPDCKYVHYDKLPATLSTTSVLSAVEKLTTKLGFTDSQVQQFDKRIRADPKFK